MTDEQVEKIIKSNMILQMNLPGIRADFEEAMQRKPWVGLTDEEIKQIELSLRQYNSRDTYDLSLKDFARAIEVKLKEKNT